MKCDLVISCIQIIMDRRFNNNFLSTDNYLVAPLIKVGKIGSLVLTDMG
jgi:hypothetical protein